MLVGARWLAGLLFRWSDLEILDDPISARLYCKHFQTKNHTPSLTELEGGEDLEQDDKSEGTLYMYGECVYVYMLLSHHVDLHAEH